MIASIFCPRKNCSVFRYFLINKLFILKSWSNMQGTQFDMKCLARIIREMALLSGWLKKLLSNANVNKSCILKSWSKHTRNTIWYEVFSKKNYIDGALILMTSHDLNIFFPNVNKLCILKSWSKHTRNTIWYEVFSKKKYIDGALITITQTIFSNVSITDFGGKFKFDMNF